MFRSRLLDAVGGAAKGVSDFSLIKNTHVTDLVSLLLDVTILVSEWMQLKKLYNKTENF